MPSVEREAPRWAGGFFWSPRSFRWRRFRTTAAERERGRTKKGNPNGSWDAPLPAVKMGDEECGRRVGRGVQAGLYQRRAATGRVACASVTQERKARKAKMGKAAGST
ncbi:hypothetical protein ACLOJK_035484 [Asimina triloba]